LDRKIEIQSGEKRAPHVTISDSSEQMAIVVNYEDDPFTRSVQYGNALVESLSV